MGEGYEFQRKPLIVPPQGAAGVEFRWPRDFKIAKLLIHNARADVSVTTIFVDAFPALLEFDGLCSLCFLPVAFDLRLDIPPGRRVRVQLRNDGSAEHSTDVELRGHLT